MRSFTRVCGNVFGCSRAETVVGMRSMEVHFGVIRDKKEISSALLTSQTMNRQLAVCYNSDGKLLVKICTVGRIIGKKDGVRVVLKLLGEDEGGGLTISFDQIQSIYPIRDFVE